jgi:hypothetical protein
MANKTKTKLAIMAEVRRLAISIFGTIPDEETVDMLSFSDRDSPGDDEPPDWLIKAMQEKSKRLRDRFPNVFITSEIVDEWIYVSVKVKDHVRIDRPEWDYKKVLAFLEETVAPELTPFYHKVAAEWESYDGRQPRVKAFYGPKWNEFGELSFDLLGNTSDGWTVRARFGIVSITHKVSTSRGLLQTVWKKLKVEIGDLSDMSKVNKQGTC